MTREGFAALHTSADPLILYNIWEAGSAQSAVRAGARAIATGSASLAGASGYADGEAITFDELLRAVRRIDAVIDPALSVDFETGFAEDLAELEANARALHESGAVSCNLEDRFIGAASLREVQEQTQRIAVASQSWFFVHARTDLFFAP